MIFDSYYCKKDFDSLKVQIMVNIVGRANLLEKNLMLGKIEGRRKRG